MSTTCVVCEEKVAMCALNKTLLELAFCKPLPTCSRIKEEEKILLRYILRERLLPWALVVTLSPEVHNPFATITLPN